VVGDNGYGIRLGAVDGRVTIAGATAVVGENSVAAALTGDVSGQVTIHGSITATGYTATSLPASTALLTADNLKKSGSALLIGGNVGGGVLIGTTTTSTDTTLDADKDGLADTTEGVGTLVSLGSAPALAIGSATQAITLGKVDSSTGGLAINGLVSAAGIYDKVNATAVQIGGLGQPVTITGGIVVGGSVAASSNGGDATAISLGSGVNAGTLINSGAITASSTTVAGGTARAILIDAGATLTSITNSGTIAATPVNSTSASYAIVDASGTLRSVSNTGAITASANAANLRAIDVSANTTGFTYTQAQSATTGASAPSLTGAINTGSGDDTINVSAGRMTATLATGAGNDRLDLSGAAVFSGSSSFGAGNDTLTLGGTSTYTGSVDFGTGTNVFTIGAGTAFSGQILNSNAGLAATVQQGGSLGLTDTNAVALGSLTVNGGTLGVTINPASGAHSQFNVAGATAITGASTVKVTLTGLVTGTSSYTVISSGTLTGSSNLGVSLAGLPFLLSGSLSANDATGTVAVNIQRKTAGQLLLLKSEAAAYDAVYADVAGNAQLTSLFLGFTDRSSFIQRYRQMLPDHAGGVFDLLYTGARNMAPSESVTPWARIGGMALWVQQGFWNATQDAVDTPGYKGSGYGATIGGDVALGDAGRIGVSAAYIFADVKNRTQSSVNANQFTGNVYWRGDWGKFHLAASGGGGIVSLTSRRALASTSSAVPEVVSNKANWNGTVLQANARGAYEAALGSFYLRPAGTLSFYRLHEKGRTEAGGGSGFDLTIGGRTSDELAATGTVALGVRLGGNPRDPESTQVTFEVEGGRRQVIESKIGATTAQFAGGQKFTLGAEDRKSGYLGNVTLSVGSQLFRFVGTVTGEKRDGYNTVLGRVALRGLF
jgi:hypothetical protein